MRGDFTIKILEIIGDLAINTSDLFDAILSSGYGASFSKVDYEISKRREERDKRLIERELKRQKKQAYYSLIYYLKKNGLIKEQERKNKRLLIITQKGKEKLFSLKKEKKEKLPVPIYQKKQGNQFSIIIFDIPELQKKKRDWLRNALRSLDFKIIQKSVWIGKVKIPKEFLDHLYEMDLIDCVEIFEISKTGSLERLM